jgi:hypothetical protein
VLMLGIASRVVSLISLSSCILVAMCVMIVVADRSLSVQVVDAPSRFIADLL